MESAFFEFWATGVLQYQVKKVYFWGGIGRDLVWIIVHFRRKMLYMFTSNLCHCHPKNKLSSPCTCHHSTRTYYYSASYKALFFLYQLLFFGTHMQWIYYMHAPGKTEPSDFSNGRLWFFYCKALIILTKGSDWRSCFWFGLTSLYVQRVHPATYFWNTLYGIIK